MIQGVNIKKLKIISDRRGAVMHMLRNDDPEFKQFGEIYFSIIYPGVVKGWSLHNKMTLNYAVIQGMIKLVLYDDRAKSKTRGKFMEVITGIDKYALITIPPLIWYGFKTIGNNLAIIANCSTIPHDHQEMKKLDPFNNNLIKYTWNAE